MGILSSLAHICYNYFLVRFRFETHQPVASLRL